MKQRKLGASSLSIAPLAFGGNVFGWTIDEAISHKLLDRFLDKGFNFIDTADTYSNWVPGNKGGESETIIGNWLKKTGKRKEIVLATKLGGDMGNGQKGLSPKYIKQAVEASLKRLQTDYIDLYQSHYDDPDMPVSATMTAFNELIKEGKVRYLGASNLSADRIQASNDFARENGLQPYSSIQPLYNLYDREIYEKEYQPLVTKEALAVIPYYALASGFLSGKYRQEEDLIKSKRGPGIKKYLNEKGASILAALDEVAARHQTGQTQVALGWLLHKPDITTPIVSATNEQQLQQVTEAVALHLSAEDMEKLDKAGSIS